MNNTKNTNTTLAQFTQNKSIIQPNSGIRKKSLYKGRINSILFKYSKTISSTDEFE